MTDHTPPPPFTVEECCEVLKAIGFTMHMIDREGKRREKLPRLKACFEKMQQHLRAARQMEPRT